MGRGWTTIRWIAVWVAFGCGGDDTSVSVDSGAPDIVDSDVLDVGDGDVAEDAAPDSDLEDVAPDSDLEDVAPDSDSDSDLEDASDDADDVDAAGGDADGPDSDAADADAGDTTRLDVDVDTSDLELPGAAFLPDTADPLAPMRSITGAECVALCDAIGASGVRDGTCFDGCTEICSGLLRRTDPRRDDATVADLADCVLNATQANCGQGGETQVLVATSACWDVLGDTLPPDDAAAADFGALGALTACRAVDAAAAAGTCAEGESTITRAACVSAIKTLSCTDGFVAGRGLEGTPTTTGATLACLRDGCVSADPACAFFRVAAATPSNPNAELLDLTCAETVRTCSALMPGNVGAPTALGCTGEAAGVPYTNPIATCVTGVARLQCVCESDSEHPLCASDTDDLDACIESSVEGVCPNLATTQCIAPTVTASGVNGDTRISETPTEALEDWCVWRGCLSGAPGFASTTCDHNVGASATPTVGECVDDLETVFAACDVTLAEAEACLMSSMTSDACHRIGTFGACAFTGDYEPCHLIANKSPCGAVIDCLEDEWDI